MNGAPPSRGRDLLNQQTGTRNVLTRIGAAMIGLSVAYVGARSLMIELSGDGAVDGRHLLKELGLFLPLATAALTSTSAVPIRKDLVRIHQLIEENEIALRERNRGQRFLRRAQSAFEMAERDDELYAITAVAMRDAADHPGEILVADSSNAHIQRLVTTSGHEAPGCSLATPRGCPAVRSGQTMKFGSPNDLAACPRLRERGLDDDHVAVCIPVNVLGTPSAVLHSVRRRLDATPQMLSTEVAALEGIAVRFGTRLGLLRAMSQSQLQADTDPLTGLLNRRAMENCIREMRTEQSLFAVVMADLDHFKELNDTYGHDTGDRALRIFARVLRSAVRDADIVARYGGEEFTIVLPGADVVRAAPVLHRLQERLIDALADARVPPFTVSLGLVDSTSADDLSELLTLADQALMQAKADGRDRIVIWDPSITVEPSSRRDAGHRDIVETTSTG